MKKVNKTNLEKIIRTRHQRDKLESLFYAVAIIAVILLIFSGLFWIGTKIC